ncbi:MAG: ATPase, T2SS/T4P/T4SS family [Janthinobacterium lividum]
MNILVVEDDPISGLVLTTALEDLGHAVTLRSDGQEAWGLLERERPDQERFEMVVTDWMMPHMDGLELCRRIRARRGLGYVYAILLTVKGLPEERIEALEAGADDFLIKPLDPAELVARMEVARRILALKAELVNSVASPRQDTQISDVLISRGLLTRAQVKQLVEVDLVPTRQLGQAILEHGWVGEEDITKARSLVMDVPYVSLEDETMDPFVLSLVPHEIAQFHKLVPLSLTDDHAQKRLRVAMADPWNIEAIDWVQRETRRRVEPLLASESAILKALKRAYHDVQDVVHDAVMSDALQQANVMPVTRGDAIDTVDARELLRQSDQAPIIRFVNTLLADAVYRGASDVHIEPCSGEFLILYRVDGQLHRVRTVTASFLAPVTSRLKVMAEMDIAERRLPQDGHIALRIAEKTVDMRVATLPTHFGERVVIRILDRTVACLQLDSLGLSPDNNRALTQLIHKPHGIVLVTGPTGSGKTTTLYAALNALIHESRNGRGRKNILTCEDPIEYQIEGISQSNVNERAGLTFARQLRAILRQDPDVILIGEIRDGETADIAFRAAMTGHLVLSTLHCNEAAGAVSRLQDLGVAPYLIASSLAGVVAQRLVPRLCLHCRRAYTPPADEQFLFKSLPERLYAPAGCGQCHERGVKGRIAIHEVLVCGDEIQAKISEKIDTLGLRQAALDRGMTLMASDGLEKVSQGLVHLEDVLWRTGNKKAT